MVATKARSAGITREQFMGKALEKMRKSREFLCSGSLIRPCPYVNSSLWLSRLSQELGLPTGLQGTTHIQQDKTVGFDLYSHLIYCSRESQDALQFIEKLVKQDNPATILLATVNTIQGTSTKSGGGGSRTST